MSGILTAGEPIPAVVTVEFFARLLGLQMSRTYELQARGAFARFELDQPAHQRPRLYSGAAIGAWLQGREADAPRQFFGSARRRTRGAR